MSVREVSAVVVSFPAYKGLDKPIKGSHVRDPRHSELFGAALPFQGEPGSPVLPRAGLFQGRLNALADDKLQG